MTEHLWERARRPRILVIDDEESIIVLLRDRLAAIDLDVHCAREPGTAIGLLDSNAYELILVDCQLTGASLADGPAFLTDVCRRQREGRVVVLTRYASPELRAVASANGVTAFLDKPQPLSRLTSMMAEITRSSNLTQRTRRPA